MIRLPRVAAVVVTVAAAALASTTPSIADAAPPPVASRVAPAHTRLVLHVTGCDRCSIAPQHAVTGQPKVWTPSFKRIGSDQRVVFRVPTSMTHGLSFVFRAPWEGGTGAVPNVVTRYAGHPAGTFVDRGDARHGRHAQGCWAGTSADRVHLDFHVSRVAGRTLDGHRTQLPLVYATHSLASWRPTVKTFKGTIGNQDAFYCTRPRG